MVGLGKVRIVKEYTLYIVYAYLVSRQDMLIFFDIEILPLTSKHIAYTERF